MLMFVLLNNGNFSFYKYILGEYFNKPIIKTEIYNTM